MTNWKKRGALYPMTALLSLGALAGAPRAQAQAAPFLDTPTNHWAYESVQDLAKKGIVIGYPDGTYGGKRPMTRYEFAVALDRALRTIDDMLKAQQNNTPPPPGTPPIAVVTQDDLNKLQALIDKFRPELDTIETNLKQAQDDIDALRADVLDAKALANKAQATADNSYGTGSGRKFQINGYIQARYENTDAYGTQARFPQGKVHNSGGYNGNYEQGGNVDSFELRRARLKFTGQLTQNSKYAIQIDTQGAVSTSNQQVTVKEGYVAYTGGNGDAAKNLTLTAGQFATPFGYALPGSQSNLLTPERALAFNESGAGLFSAQDYEKGVQLGYNTSHQLLFLPSGLKLSVAVVNGTGRTSEESDRYKDQIYRVAYQTPNKVIGAGISYYNGQINTAVPGTATGVVFGSSGSLYTGRKKELYGADLQIALPTGPFLNAEYVGGLFEQRSYFASAAATGLTTDYAKDNKVDGYYVQGGYTFGPSGSHPFTLAASYDVLKRGEGKGSVNNLSSVNGVLGGSSDYTDENVGYGALYNLDKATRLRLWYTHPDKVAHTPGTTAPPKYGLFTGEIQVKF